MSNIDLEQSSQGHVGAATADQDALPKGREGTWWLVAVREMKVRLTDRNFIISTVVTMLVLVGVLVVQGLLSGGTSTTTVAVPEGNSEATTIVQSAQSVDDSLRAQPVADPQAAVTQGDADLALTPDGDAGWVLAADGAPGMTAQSALTEAVQGVALERNAQQVGTTAADLLAGGLMTVQDLSGEDSSQELVGLIAGVVLAMLFYMSSILFGMTIASSVVEEKQSRIVEILAAMIPVRQLLIGKIVGNTILALGQMALLLGAGLIGLSFTDYDQYYSMVTPVIGWYIPLFIVGFLGLASIWAAAGAIASRNEDLQSTTMPLTMVLVVVLFAGLYLDGNAQVIASFVPVISTVMMPIRMLQGEVAFWEPLLALGLTVAFCAITIAIGARLYSRGVLQTQGRVGWKDAWRARA